MWDQDGLDLEEDNERAVAESDGEAEQSEDEGLAQEETTGLELGRGVLSSNLTK